MNQKLIEQLRNGEIAVVNDGSQEQLDEVLKEAFPNDKVQLSQHPGFHSYFRCSWDHNDWLYAYSEKDEDLEGKKLVSVKDFFKVTESKQEKIQRLKKELEELESEPELIVGKWYKAVDPENKAIFCIQEIYEDKMYGFGFSQSGRYVLTTRENFKGYWAARSEEITPATDKEVKNALEKQAKKLGFKDGVKIKSPFKMWSKYNEINFEDDFKKIFYKPEVNEFIFGGVLIFKDGKWAEIIEDSQLPKINDYEATFENDILGYGCAKLPIEWFLQLDGNRKITSLTLDSGVTINETQINQIREYYDKVRKRD